MESGDLNPGVALIELDSAPDDPAESDPAYQRELAALLHSLRSNGIGVSARYDALGSERSTSGLSGAFVITVPSLGPLFCTVIGEGLGSRYGRKAKVRIGDTEMEAQTVEELFRLAKDYQKRSHRAR
jgi:hypothetical protein